MDKMLALIIKELPEYEHLHPLTTHARAMENMRLGKQVCHPGLFITEERKKFAYFSTVSLVSPPINLITRAKDITRLGIKEPVNLEQIFEQPELAIGLVHSRSYGNKIDDIIARYPRSRFVRLPIEEGDKMFDLVSKNRLSFTFSYPFELAYYNQTMRLNNDLVGLQIAGEAKFVTGNVACSKTPWGKAFIEKLDRILFKIRDSEEYIAAMTSWLDKGEKRSDYKAFLKKAYADSIKSN